MQWLVLYMLRHSKKLDRFLNAQRCCVSDFLTDIYTCRGAKITWEKRGGGEKQSIATGGETGVEGSALCQEDSNKLEEWRHWVHRQWINRNLRSQLKNILVTSLDGFYTLSLVVCRYHLGFKSSAIWGNTSHGTISQVNISVISVPQ